MPLETEQDKELLQSWLINFLQDSTDSDSELLAQYLVAVIVSTPLVTEAELTAELSEFVDDQAPFVANSLLAAISTNSYRTALPKPATPEAAPIPAPSPPILPAKAALAPAQPGVQIEGDSIKSRTGAPFNAPSGPRNSRAGRPDPIAAGSSDVHAGPSRSRSPTGRNTSSSRRDRQTGRERTGLHPRRSASPIRVLLANGREVAVNNKDWDGRTGNGRGLGAKDGPGLTVPRKELCRDYHERGYCPRGMDCLFEHSEDSMYAPLPPLNPDGSPAAFPLLPGMPGFPLLPNGMPDVAAFLGMGGMQGMMGVGSPPMIGPGTSGQASEAVSDGAYSPHRPNGGGPPQAPMGAGSMQGFPPGMFTNGIQVPFGMPMMGFPPMGQDFMAGRGGRGGPIFGRGGRGVRGRGGGSGFGGGNFNGNGAAHGSEGSDPGRFAGQAQPPKDRGTTTLVLTDIPREHLSVESIQAHFKRHGTVTNVAVEAGQRKALVSFSSNHEAFSAWKDPEPVFGNRHVKVLWHRPTGEMGAAGQAKLAASAALLENMRKIEEQGVEAVQGTRMTPAQIRQQVEKVKRNALELEKSLAEQKILMARLTNKSNPLSAEEKPVVKARLKELSSAYAAMKQAQQGDNEILAKIRDSQAKTKQRLEAIQTAQKEAKRAKENVDGVHTMDDLMSVDAPADGDEDADPETLQLRATLAALRKQATSLGIDPSNPSTSGSSSPAGAQPFNPQGRRTLDNRPTALLLTASGSGLLPENALQSAKRHYEELLAGLPQNLKSIGGQKINLVKDVRILAAGKKALVSFGSRAVAEAALRSGPVLPSFPALSVSWHAAPADAGSLAKVEESAADRPASQASAGASGDAGSAMDGVEVEYKRGEREDDE